MQYKYKLMQNFQIEFAQWVDSLHNNIINSNKLNCGCFKPSNGFWKDCDCSLTQHFACRKTATGIINTEIFSKFNLFKKILLIKF